MLPKLIKDAILSVDGRGYAGRIESIQWPKLTRKLEEYRAGGMNGPVEVDLGSEKLEMEFELDEQSSDLLRLWGACSATGVRYRINGSAESDNPDCNGSAVEVIGLGRFREIDLGAYKAGEIQTVKYSVALASFTYRLDGETIIDIDHANNIMVVDGVDLLEKRREHLRM